MDGSIFSSFLTALGVRHTASYSDSRFASMPFHTLFGLKNLLKEYGVAAGGVRLARKEDISRLKPPFILPVDHTFIIVKRVTDSAIYYESLRTAESMPIADFLPAWDGTVFLAAVDADSREPDYGSHRLAEVMARLRNIGLWALVAVVLVWLLVRQGEAGSIWMILLTALYVAGIALSFMLVQKSLGISNRHADRVCKVLQEGGCDTIAASDAASFLGIFHWSETGLAFFGVSLGTLLLCPSLVPGLALVNACALPYTVWSIYYQKFRACAWCTMCVGVQLILWLCFFCFLFDGAFAHVLPLRADYLLLCIIYGLALLGLNRLDAFITRMSKPSNS